MSTHTHQKPKIKRLQLNKKIAEILRTVPYEKGFHFYTASGNFTGETATSLEAFEKKLQVVPAASVNFHLQHGDYQKWIEETLGDDKLAKKNKPDRANASSCGFAKRTACNRASAYKPI
jgi:hypothetical protein